MTALDLLNQTTTYGWGYGHQLLSVKDNANNLYSYTRNALGQVTQIQSPAVRYNYAYDTSHRRIQTVDSRAGKTLNYTYSPGGLLNKMLDSDNNRSDYLYDAAGRLTGTWTPNYDYVSFGYDAGGRLIEKWFTNGVDARYSYNADNTLASLVNKNGSTTISNHVYTYDALANRQTQAETVNGSTLNYTYTGFSTQVSVLKVSKELGNSNGNVFVADTDHGNAPSMPGGGPKIDVEWKAPGVLGLVG